jgi:formylglycine-generating enzyme required for sulfatase activity
MDSKRLEGPSSTTAGHGKFKVFISYSRDDLDFADQLDAALKLLGFEVTIDRESIPGGDEWRRRLSILIREADTVVFVLSPSSAESSMCAWEVEQATGLGKHIVPVVCRPLDNVPPPHRLRDLNYIFFCDERKFPGSGFGRGQTQLVEVLNKDPDWLRDHTRYLLRATEWETGGREESRLLFGSDIVAAQAWAARRPNAAPEPTALEIEFIRASAQEEMRRVSAERKRLDEIANAQAEREKALEAERAALHKAQAAARRAQAMRLSAFFLLVGVIVVLVGWLNQGALEYQWDWYTKTRPYMLQYVRPKVLTLQDERLLKPSGTLRECAKDCPEMIVIPPGTFLMGSLAAEHGHEDKEAPQRTIEIARPFAVSKFDVTFQDWDACVGVRACPTLSDSKFGRGMRPAINVTWDEAQVYVAWLRKMTGRPYRLLSEAEWEYAARAGTATAYPWGDEIGSGNANCNGCDGRWGGKSTSPVGSFRPNAFGLFDMHGNVFQYVEDCFQDNLSKVPTDGSALLSGDCSLRVVRGGSWIDGPSSSRSARRDWFYRFDRVSDIGFRIARTLTAVGDTNGAPPGAQ